VERRKSILEEMAEKKNKEPTLSAEAKNVIIMLEYFKLEVAMILPQIYDQVSKVKKGKLTESKKEKKLKKV
jgi:hypothetical protein